MSAGFKHDAWCWLLVGAFALCSLASAAEVVTLPDPSGKDTVPTFSVPLEGTVARWIRSEVPDFPAASVTIVIRKFLAGLQQRDPTKLDVLLTEPKEMREQAPTLLRLMAVEVGGEANTGVRDSLARHRIQAVMAADGASIGVGESAAILAGIRELSSVHHRRLLDGRLEDDDLRLLIKKVRPPAAKDRSREAAGPKTTSVGEIVSAFVRENQEGAALQRLQAYTIEGVMSSPGGKEQTIVLSRMRPNLFRMVVLSEGATRYIFGFDGRDYWQHVPGQKATLVRRDAVGSRRYLGEFVDPLFGDSGAVFEKLSDGRLHERRVMRIQVRRPDGSSYVAQIDPESFRQLGREQDDKSRAEFADFHDVAGLTIPFRETVSDATGTTTFVIRRMTPNPGLVEALFSLPSSQGPDYYALDHAGAPIAQVDHK